MGLKITNIFYINNVKFYAVEHLSSEKLVVNRKPPDTRRKQAKLQSISSLASHNRVIIVTSAGEKGVVQ